jgi:hypothetical protein
MNLATKPRKQTMPPPVDYDDFAAILSCEDATLPALRPVVKPTNGGGNGTPALATVTESWIDDPVSVKLEKIRAVFLNAKTPTEVYAEAAIMPVGDWLEMVGKLTKQTPDAPVRITAIRIELPPRDYQMGEVVEIEVPA